MRHPPSACTCGCASTHIAGAVQLRNAITEQFGVELPATAALDFPTVLALAGYVAQSLGGAAKQNSAVALATVVSLDAAWSDCSGGLL